MRTLIKGLFLSKTRRLVVKTGLAAGLALIGATAALGLLSAPATSAHAAGISYPMSELMAKEALPDLPLGKANAPVTIIEYASMTCPHCAEFHAETYPYLLKTYIDTGEVRFILREFPLDQFATAAFMLARCAGPSKRNAMVDLLFDEQANWAFTDKPIEDLRNLVKQTGMTKQQFDACLNNQVLYNEVNSVKGRAARLFGVNATPTFFINGKKITGAMSKKALDKILQPLLKKKS